MLGGVWWVVVGGGCRVVVDNPTVSRLKERLTSVRSNGSFPPTYQRSSSPPVEPSGPGVLFMNLLLKSSCMAIILKPFCLVVLEPWSPGVLKRGSCCVVAFLTF